MADKLKEKKVAPKIKDLVVSTKAAKDLKGGYYSGSDVIPTRAATPRRRTY